MPVMALDPAARQLATHGDFISSDENFCAEQVWQWTRYIPWACTGPRLGLDLTSDIGTALQVLDAHLSMSQHQAEQLKSH